MPSLLNISSLLSQAHSSHSFSNMSISIWLSAFILYFLYIDYPPITRRAELICDYDGIIFHCQHGILHQYAVSHATCLFQCRFLHCQWRCFHWLAYAPFLHLSGRYMKIFRCFNRCATYDVLYAYADLIFLRYRAIIFIYFDTCTWRAPKSRKNECDSLLLSHQIAISRRDERCLLFSRAWSDYFSANRLDIIWHRWLAAIDYHLFHSSRIMVIWFHCEQGVRGRRHHWPKGIVWWPSLYRRHILNAAGLIYFGIQCIILLASCLWTMPLWLLSLPSFTPIRHHQGRFLLIII